MSASTDTRAWNDCPYPQTTCAKGGTNGDGIAQDGEIGPSTNPNFGKVTSTPKLDPNFRREYDLQYSAGVQHQIKSGFAVSFNWFRRTDYDPYLIVNRAVDPITAWTPFTMINPLDGSTITAYNLNKDAFGRPADLYQTNADQSKRRNTYIGYETSFTGRLPNGGHIFGSWTIDRTTDITCDAPIGTNYYGYPLVDGNNVTNASLNDPNSLRYCDERGLIPFRNEVKVIAAIPIKWGLEGSVVYQSSPEILKYVNWDITKGTVYPVDCKGCTPGALVNPNLTNTTERIALAVPGSRFSDRLNQLDLGIKRTFVFREKYRVQAQVDVFNVNNAHTVLVEGQNLGTTPGSSVAPFVLGGPGGKPTSILQARLLRLAMQFHF